MEEEDHTQRVLTLRATDLEAGLSLPPGCRFAFPTALTRENLFSVNSASIPLRHLLLPPLASSKFPDPGKTWESL